MQVYVKADREGTPNAQLKGIRKVSLQAGESREVTLQLSAEAFALYDEQGVNQVKEGQYLIFVGGAQPDSRSEKLTGKKVAALKVHIEESFVI